jgi:hypothetical protein
MGNKISVLINVAVGRGIAFHWANHVGACHGRIIEAAAGNVNESRRETAPKVEWRGATDCQNRRGGFGLDTSRNFSSACAADFGVPQDPVSIGLSGWGWISNSPRERSLHRSSWVEDKK